MHSNVCAGHLLRTRRKGLVAHVWVGVAVPLVVVQALAVRPVCTCDSARVGSQLQGSAHASAHAGTANNSCMPRNRGSHQRPLRMRISLGRVSTYRLCATHCNGTSSCSCTCSHTCLPGRDWVDRHRLDRTRRHRDWRWPPKRVRQALEHFCFRERERGKRGKGGERGKRKRGGERRKRSGLRGGARYDTVGGGNGWRRQWMARRIDGMRKEKKLRL